LDIAAPPPAVDSAAAATLFSLPAIPLHSEIPDKFADNRRYTAGSPIAALLKLNISLTADLLYYIIKLSDKKDFSYFFAIIGKISRNC
jgi:hypothetical protein